MTVCKQRLVTINQSTRNRLKRVFKIIVLTTKTLILLYRIYYLLDSYQNKYNEVIFMIIKYVFE